MQNPKGVIDKNPKMFGQLLGKVQVILSFSHMKPHILQEQSLQTKSFSAAANAATVLQLFAYSSCPKKSFC